MEKKFNVKTKELLPYVLITVLIEVIVFLLLKDSGATFSIIASIILIPIVIVTVYLMFYSLERVVLISLFAIPILPIIGYIMLRMNMLDYQYLIYLTFYLVSAIAMLKNGLLKNIDNSKLIVKNKIIKILMALLLVVNIIFAYDKQLTFMIISLSFIPFAIYMYIIKTLKVESKKKFFDKVIYAICLGCIVSSIPDLLFYIMNWINGNRGGRGFGPLTGNYILMYNLIVLVVCLNKWVKEEKIKNKWTVLVVSLLIIISTQFSRGGYFTFIAIMVALLIFNIKNWKRYLPIFLIGVSCLSFNVGSRPEVMEDSNLAEIKELIVDQKEDSISRNELIANILNSQSVTRQAIWGATIDMSLDYPYSGVGLGNLKYFYDDYTKGKKGYTDAHNLFLNISSELGIPFMVLSIILLLCIAIVEFIKYIKTSDKRIKLNRLTIVVLCGTILLYGNLTGIALQHTAEIYGFTEIFILMALLTYRDCVEVI